MWEWSKNFIIGVSFGLASQDWKRLRALQKPKKISLESKDIPNSFE